MRDASRLLVRRLRTFMELSALVNSTLESGEIRRRAIEAAGEMVDAERASLLLLDEETRELCFEVALGDTGQTLREARLAPGEGIAGWVAQTGEPVIVRDVQMDPRHIHALDEKSGFVPRDVLCVPVSCRGRLIGVLEAMNKRDGTFDSDDLELLGALAHQVAVAIENAGLYHELKESFYETIGLVADMIEKRDPYTGGHTRRVMQHALATGIALHLSAADIEALHLAAVLHDIGKVAVPDTVLAKTGLLDDDEWRAMRAHAETAAEILGHVRGLRASIPGVRGHHERLDGAGYPDGLAGEDIPLQARIIAVADAFDAMTTDRPYRTGMSVADAVRELRRCTGTQFDGRVVGSFVRTLDPAALEEEEAPPLAG